jgi:hypothetical protein
LIFHKLAPIAIPTQHRYMQVLDWYYSVFDTNRVWVFEDNFVFNIMQVYIPYKNLHT